jgi:hypothetical protein
MWKALYYFAWAMIVLNGVIGPFLSSGMNFDYEGVPSWLVGPRMIFALCCMAYVALYWAIDRWGGSFLRNRHNVKP